MAELISQREEEEALQREAEERLAAEQAARAEEDARLRELYPLPEDDEDYVEEGSEIEGEAVDAGEETVEGDQPAAEAETSVEDSTVEEGAVEDTEAAVNNDDEDGAR